MLVIQSVQAGVPRVHEACTKCRAGGKPREERLQPEFTAMSISE